MRRRSRFAVAATCVLALAVVTAAFAAPSAREKSGRDAAPRKHDFDNPLRAEQRERSLKALEMKVAGKVPAGAKVVKVAKGQYVELARETTDRIFVLLVEFGDRRHDNWPDSKVSEATKFAGPSHNNIPPPDRATDNTTLWQPDYSATHFEDMYFNRMAKYYERQSSGRYSVTGDVVNWVRVPFNEARYGTDDCNHDGVIDYSNDVDSIVCPTVVSLVRDAMAYWVKGKLDGNWTMQQVKDYLKTFDVWDRYDIDGDGNFSEPDGVIDHFQIVHAGGDQAAGSECVNLRTGCDPQYGTDAIWSHRSAAIVSPDSGCPFDQFGVPSLNVGDGTSSTLDGPIPTNRTGICIFDYTMQPENGGLGVFAHEYGHDLGLPDLYDTTGNTCAVRGGFCENSTGYWSLMSSGANIGDGDGPPTGKNGIGDAPTGFGAWEKLQLGWLNYEVALAGKKSSHKLGPASTNTKQAQALITVLPGRARDVPIYEPLPGSTQAQWSTSGNELDTRLTKSFALPSGGTVTADVNYVTEYGWDFVFVESSPDGTTWTPVATNLSDPTDLSGLNSSGKGMTGDSGGWVQLSATVPAGTTQIRFRYRTDQAVAERGAVIDNVVVNGGPADTFESGNDGWTQTGFTRTGPINSVPTAQYYIAENRNYQDDDASLKTAYNFGNTLLAPNTVEYFPYQDGMLVTYWDTFWADNNTTEHPGEGQILPVDAHPAPLIRGDGNPWRSRVQGYDSTFGLESTDPITLHYDGVETRHPSLPGVPVFDDTQSYWSAATPFSGVNVPKTGTTIRVKSVSAQGALMQVEVAPAK